MKRRAVDPGRWWWLAALSMLVATGQAAAGAAGSIDTAASRVGFTVKTRWGQTLEGRFPTLHAETVARGDGQQQAILRMATTDVEIAGHPRYTRVMRSEAFFDAAHHPDIEFVSDVHSEELVRESGRLGGFLTIRGVRRREVLLIAPDGCTRPGIDCDVVATGTVYRSDYGMDNWGIALSDRVQLYLRTRLKADRGGA